MRRCVKKCLLCLLHCDLPLPVCLRPVIRCLYRACVLASESGRLLYKWTIVSPLVRSIARVGPRLRIERIPYVRGAGDIEIGEDVYISGKIGIAFACRSGVRPRLAIGDRSFIGHECSFIAMRGISIGKECLLGKGVQILDNDSHPLDPAARRSGQKVSECNAQEVIIGDGVWLAPRVTVLKGVHIGENAVVGVSAVVTRDVPANTVVAGNPAEVIGATIEPKEAR